MQFLPRSKEMFIALGEEKHTKLVNDIMRGIGLTTLCRMLQREWGDFQDVAESTLMQRLSRYRQALAKEALGKLPKDTPAPKSITQMVSTNLDARILSLKAFRTEATKLDVLTEMRSIVSMQQFRIDMLFKKEMKDGKIQPALTNLLDDYKRLLLDVQKLQFDLGLEEFKGPLPGMRGASETKTFPDGSTTQRTIFEAANLMDSIFHTRGIADPQVVEGQI